MYWAALCLRCLDTRLLKTKDWIWVAYSARNRKLQIGRCAPTGYAWGKGLSLNLSVMWITTVSLLSKSIDWELKRQCLPCVLHVSLLSPAESYQHLYWESFSNQATDCLLLLCGGMTPSRAFRSPLSLHCSIALEWIYHRWVGRLSFCL